MPVDDCLLPIPTPFREGVPLLKAGARYGPLAPLPELDLYGTAAAVSSAASSSCGDNDASRCTLRESLNRLVAEAPGTRPVAISSRDDLWHHLEPLIPSWDDYGLHLRPLALSKEDLHGQDSAEAFSAMSLQDFKDTLAEKPKQSHPSGVAGPRSAPRGKYARSKAGWASKERSTPEGYNREEHGWRFEYPYLPGMDPTDMACAYAATIKKAPVVRPPKIKKSIEERKAIRERKIMLKEKASLHHVQTALCKYNRTNSTTFELDEITVKCLFFEFGGPCYHYNFTAKLDNHPSVGGNSNLFFAEINCPLRSEDDVLVCCIVGEKDAGHCHACEDYRPTMIHPSSRAYGGGNTTAIDYPDEDSSSSDSDY